MDKKSTLDGLFRAFLRSIPIIPVPELYDLALAITKSQTQLDKDISDAVEALQKSAHLISTLESEVKSRADRLAHLQEQQKRLMHLSEITSEQTKALAVEIEKSIGKSKKWDWAVSLGINLFAGILIFLLGIALSGWIKHILGMTS